MPTTKSEGCKMIVSTRSSKLTQTKKLFFNFYALILAKRFDSFFEFFNIDHFRRRFTTLKQSLQKKSHIPRRSPRKYEDFVHLTFLIFKLLSHSFLNDQSIFLKNDNIENLQKCLESFWALNK